ncbi:kinesin-like protein KIF27 isoform X4 [Actinia tenebrosa]|uniref:Kinesin-like protein KIF27 isoform X4 n=1 Tax=Actinia tenebrosa TaxID=6105 RepID=A0A6P8IMW6_ACTTE|nr:kinesin-like protein KIF27 isoform X4 [Actinia tenebrosa]
MDEVPIKVAVRVRPLIGQEKVHNVGQCVYCVPSKPQLVLGKDRGFTFDFVFNPATSQVEVYEACVEPLVKSCLQGYNATVFAYGQTGSGKTYTVGGIDTGVLRDSELGIIPRAVKQIFQNIEENHHKLEYEVHVSYIEIYLEELRDLLDLETSSKDIHIRENEKGDTVLIGATEQLVETIDEVMSYLDTGSAARHTGITNMNEASSRSHAIFTLYISQKPMADLNEEDMFAANQQTTDQEQDTDYSDYKYAKFHFVDLAGSERAVRTGNVGERFKESVQINSGLLSLGNVISALADHRKKALHVPYRDSKVTRLLKDSLGGNARTVMITCLSPAEQDFGENLNSLKYATRARNIRNKPIINRDPQNTRLAAMQHQIIALREELEKRRLTTVSSTDDKQKVEKTEEKLQRYRGLCEAYIQCAVSASALLRTFHSNGTMNNTQASQYEDWMKMLDDITTKYSMSTSQSDVSYMKMIDKLRVENIKYKSELSNDEEIFAKQSGEIDSLRRKLKGVDQQKRMLTQQLQEYQLIIKKKDDQLFEQQLQLNNAMLKGHEQCTVGPGMYYDVMLKGHEQSTVGPGMYYDVMLKGHEQSTVGPGMYYDVMLKGHEQCTVGPGMYCDVMLKGHKQSTVGPAYGRLRANTAPTDHTGIDTKLEGRDLHSSPSILSADRMIQGFRARSQLLMRRYEEKDEVLCTLSESSESEEEQDKEKEDSRELGRTWKVRGNLVGERNIPSFTLSGLQPTDNTEKNSNDLLKSLRSSTQVISQEVKQTEIKLQEAQHRMRDLTINIRQKEELIKELMKSEQEERKMKKHFSKKVQSLQDEVEAAKKEVDDSKKILEESRSKANVETSEKRKTEMEYKKKLQAMESKLQALEKKQKDGEKMTLFHQEKERKLKELESYMERMKNQQETVNKRLKEESEKKSRLERDMSKHLQRIKELEKQGEQQQKIIKRKTEQVANAQRRLRTINKQGSDDKGDDTMGYQKKQQWLDSEIDKVLQQKQAMEALEEDLKKREEIVKNREVMINEKSALEIKKLRSSQILNKDILRLSTQLMKVEREIKENEESEPGVDVCVKTPLTGLLQTRDELHKQRNILESKLQDGELLDPGEERRLIELDEGIEALDAVIEYKNDSIKNKQQQLQSNDDLNIELITEIKSLPREEATNLLSKYLDKVIQLRQTEAKLHLDCNEKDVKIDEQERIIGELQRGLQQALMAAERKVTNLQQKHEQKIQFLMSQVRDAENAVRHEGKESDNHSRVQQLERDVYYYKKTCRELKKKLRENKSAGIESTDITASGRTDTELEQSVDKCTAIRNQTSSSTRDSPGRRLQSSSPTQDESQADLVQDSIEPALNPWGPS